MGKGIVLASGGLDSTLAIIECAKDSKVTPLFINYGQYAWKKEKEYLLKSCHLAGAGSVFQVDLQMSPYPNAYGPEEVGSVWNRTMALVGIASMWAYINGNDYDYIAVGSHLGDVGPDIKPGEYDLELCAALVLGTRGQIRLKLPVRDLTNEEIGIGLRQYNTSFEAMYSCYWDPPCGFKSTNEDYRCPGCRRKIIAMKAAGITDKDFLDFPNGNTQGRTYQSPLAEPVNY